MSPTLSHSRLFKATRRFIVAEITLIVVIVILFAWSTYVLFKLFAGDTDSLFGFSVNTSAENNNKLPISLTNAQNLINERATSLGSDKLKDELAVDRLVSQSRALPSLHQSDMKERLASYKSQIIKELLDRQERLLNDRDGGGQLASLLGLNGAGSRSRSGQQMIELRQSEHPNEARLEPNLVYLNNAPSLMQLSPSSADTQEDQLTSTILPLDTEASQDENGSEPFEEAQPSRVERGQLDGPLTTTTTTTEQPPVLASDLETTTLEPASQEANDNEAAQDESQTTTSSPDPGADQPNLSGKESDGESEPQDQSSVEDEVTNPDESSDRRQKNEPADDEERARKAVKSIDEEVDRMTQPSLGVASRQIKPADFLKSAVQFDDALAMSLDDSRGRHHLEPPPSLSPKAAPNDHKLFDDNLPPNGAKVPRILARRQDPQRISEHHRDLLTADNFNKSPPLSPPAPTSKNQAFDGRSRLPPGTSATGEHALHSKSQPENTRRQLAGATSNKLAVASRKQKEEAHFRQRRAAMNQVTLPRFGHQLDSKGSNSMKRRSDGDDEEEEGEEEGGQGEEEPVGRSVGLGMSPVVSQLNQFAGQTAQSREMPTGEPTLEDLLAHKQLLDSLQQNMPPPPPVQSPISRVKLLTSRPSNSSNGSNRNEEPQSADTHYSVDHGLLLYPSSDEEHHHSSKSHKSHKASKKKDKKKMTVAVKKGGHKSKKHKKEEKKYHKEKKFKGAKKGKKMKKGKGGKGGKKGKKLFKDKGYKKKGFKNTYVKNEFGSKKSYFDEFRDKDFKKKWKNFDDKYNYAQMKKWQAKDVKKAKKMKDHGAKFKKYDKGKWKKQKFADMSSGSKKSLSKHDKDF